MEQILSFLSGSFLEGIWCKKKKQKKKNNNKKTTKKTTKTTTTKKKQQQKNKKQKKKQKQTNKQTDISVWRYATDKCYWCYKTEGKKKITLPMVSGTCFPAVLRQIEKSKPKVAGLRTWLWLLRPWA